MLPPFHGERMRSYESIMREATEQAIDSWPEGQPFAMHPHMQAITLEVILRAVFGVSDTGAREQLRERLPLLLAETSSAALQFRFMLSRRLRLGDPLARLREITASIDELAVRRDRRASRRSRARPSARTSSRC